MRNFLPEELLTSCFLAMTDCQSYGMMSCMASLSSSNTNRVLFFDVTGFNMAFSYRVMTSFHIQLFYKQADLIDKLYNEADCVFVNQWLIGIWQRGLF